MGIWAALGGNLHKTPDGLHARSIVWTDGGDQLDFRHECSL